MKKNQNKLLAFIIAVTMLISIMPSTVTYADTLSSSQKQVAIPLSSEPIERSAVSAQGMDVYSYTMPGAGYVTFSVQNLEYKAVVQDSCLVSVHETTGKNLNSYVKAGEEILSTGRYNFKSGDVIYITVSIQKKYSISANFTGTTSWESESNDSFATATHLSAGKARCGTAYYTYDQDFYSFVASKDKKGKQQVKLNFSIATASKEKNGILDYYRITVYDAAKHEVCSPSKNLSQNYSTTFKVTPGKKYYILVDAAGSNNIDALYKIKVAYKK